MGTFAICAGSIYHFYDLHGQGTLYPYKTQAQQTIAILRTALIATLASFWPIWFATRQIRNPGKAVLWSGAGTLIALVLYGIAGCGGVLGGDMEVLFPSLFFSEFNFLTFIFGVAPATAISTGLIVYSSSRFASFLTSHPVRKG